MLLVTAQEMRRLDEHTIEHCGQSGAVLMERAGAGAVDVLLSQFPHVRRRRVVIVAGKGNNGGDGFVMARLLRRHGVRAEVVLLGSVDLVKGDAALALQKMRRARVPLRETAGEIASLCACLDGAALIVDALLGTGLSGTVEGAYAEAIEAMNASGVPIFAVDTPSGLDSDRGVPLGTCVQAEATATFGFAKIGQMIYPGLGAVGALAIVDIGIDPRAVEAVQPRSWLIEANEMARLVPVRAPDAHKGDNGHALIVAGSRGHSGAARMAAEACCRVGAGLTTLAGPASLNPVFSSGAPEVMTAALADRDGQVCFDEPALHTLLENKDAVLIGPGLGTHDDAVRVVRHCLTRTGLPLVVDADALTCVARDLELLRPARGRVVLTPHPGEMARLLGCDVAAVQGDRPGRARDFARKHGCVLVLKGARTLIAAPGGELWINPTGNAGMASGGMGDVLAGLIVGLLAQGLDGAEAARLAVYVHGAAADVLANEQGPVGYLASDVARAVPRRLAALRQQLPLEPRNARGRKRT